MSAMLLFVSAMLQLFEGVFVKHYSSKHEKGGFLFTALLCFFSMLTFTVSDQDGFFVPPMLWVYAIIAGTLYCMASFLTYIALGCGSFAISMLILSYSLVFSIGYGLFFLNEAATVFTYLGIVLILSSLFLTGKKSSDTPGEKISLKWVICIGLSMLGSGMFSVICRAQQIAFDDSCTNEFMVIALGFSTIVLLIVGLFMDGRNLVYILKHGAIWTALAGCANGVGNMLTLVLHTKMPISISTPVRAGTKIVLSFVISMLVFREKFDRRQLLGVLLGAGAVVLLNL